MTLQDRLTIDALLPGYLAACAKREFDTALAAQEAAITKMAARATAVRMGAALESQRQFWKSRGLQ
jgi:hypothetical protein